MKFCENCDNFLIPTREGLYCQACDEYYGMSKEEEVLKKEIIHRKEDYMFVEPIVKKNGNDKFSKLLREEDNLRIYDLKFD